MPQPATKEQQEYLDRAAHYADRAMLCRGQSLWHEAATNFGSALESLLLLRYGSGKLAKLVERFDNDPLFNDIILHDGSTRMCPTCGADEIRKLRNAVHPNCWIAATPRNVDQAMCLVLMIYHVLVVCEPTRVAVFQISPDSILAIMEGRGVKMDSDVVDQGVGDEQKA